MAENGKKCRHRFHKTKIRTRRTSPSVIPSSCRFRCYTTSTNVAISRSADDDNKQQAENGQRHNNSQGYVCGIDRLIATTHINTIMIVIMLESLCGRMVV